MSTHPIAPSTPIAIVGMGCRFPGGAHNPAAYLAFLEACGDGVVEQPQDRWNTTLFQDDNGAAGRTEVRRAGFLQQDVFSFDPGFFGISPREAGSLDPQQRLLLEVAQEAFEDAGLTKLAGSATGVFVGGFTLDAMLARFSALNQDSIDNHTATSSSMTLLSNRLSYAFDLRGPSMTVDTACSSSLVALHLACEALSRGECQVAVAGGVNVMLLPYYQIVMSKGHFLAKDGRSKTFEASADGYGRGEGAGLVVLKTLAQALADGDTIHAVIRGTSVNQDGATDGIPMPNPDAQRALIEATCARAGVEASSIGYVEAHGTGTRAGDACETRAIGATYGRGRAEPLPVGSVKASIGHLEAAAGIAGLIKAVLAVRERRVWPHRKLVKPNPEIPFSELGIRVPQAVEPWPQAGPARAAINSFGYGGTNAHAIVESPPVVERPAASPRPGPALLPLSARSAAGLAATARALLPLAERPHALAGALAHRRAEEPVRAAVVAESAEELHESLLALAEGRPHAALSGPNAPCAGRVWVFTGMGPQWWGMGRELYAQEPVFASALREVDSLFRERAGWSILDALLAPEASSQMARNAIAQPANLLLQVGLVTQLRAWGFEPDAILGHSVGEVAAAWAAGCLSLEDAVTVSVHRSRLQQRAAGTGGMLAVGLGREELPALLGDSAAVLAADNAPDLVTLAGPKAELARIAALAEARGLFARPVRVEVPYHSPLLDPIREELLESLAHINPRPPRVPLFSTLTGAPVQGAVHDAHYWWQNTRQPVRLRDATGAALDAGHRLFIELGPHPVLAPSIQSVMRARGDRGQTLHALRRGEPERRSLLGMLGAAWTAAQPLRWDLLAPDLERLPLPLTPWQRTRHWAEAPSARHARLGRPGAHPLLSARDEDRWTTRIAGEDLAFLRQHQVDGVVVIPGAATAEACLSAAQERGQEALVEDLRFEAALVLPESQPVDMRLQIADDRVEVLARVGDGAWSRHATARLSPAARYRKPANLNLDALRARIQQPVDLTSFYASLEDRGLRYGPAFRGVRQLWRQGPELLAELRLEGVDTAGWNLHPALLDAAFQCMVAVANPVAGVTVLPVGVRRIRCLRPVGEVARVYGRLNAAGEGAWEGDLSLCDERGEVLVDLRGLRCEAALRKVEGRGWLHADAWVPLESPTQKIHGEVNILGDGPLATALRAARTSTPGAATTILCAEPSAEDPTGARLCHELLRGLRGERVLVVTVGGVAVTPGEAVHPAAAAARGFVRVAMNEHPERAPRLLDLAHPAVEPVLAALDIDEEELAFRDGFYALRVRKVAPEALPAPRARVSVKAGAAPMALEVGQPGLLDSLAFRAVPRRGPGPGEVEVEVEAASLNFKDVMKAMGMLSDTALENAYLGRGLGLEAAGRVVRVGPGVRDLAVGDEVFTYHGGALRSHIVADARFVVRRPEALSAADGASAFVFLTAWYALVHAGRVLAGETVLIHSAAGGVGLAALQIARMLGAEVIATAGTAEKRAYLRDLGVEHVFDSRTLDFADEVRAATGGRGVDVVLNSLAGPALVRSLELVASGGRFLELGKQDFARDRSIGLRPFNRSISLIAIDLDRMATEKPAWFAPVAREVMDAFADGRLQPLPTELFPVDQVSAAFRALGSGERIGKVVLAMRAGRVSLLPALAQPIRGGRTWLVTGGLGGFGLRTAAWLVERGVRDLVLASRRGQVDPAEAHWLDAMRAAGATVRPLALDVTDESAVQRAIRGIPNLGGVVHAAMELADRPLRELDAASIDRAMGAKARGAWNLHLATADRDLDHFLLFGSISARVGNPGQAAYAAANAALDGLAQHRAALCLPATCVSWGALGEAGVVARDDSTRAHLQSLGLTPMNPRAALDRLAEVLPSASPTFTLVDIDWDRWARAVPGVGWRRLSELLSAAKESENAGLGALSPAERRASVAQMVREAAAAVFRMDPAALDAERSLRDQGLDSILAVELGVGLGAKLGIQLSAMDLLAGRGITALAEEILRRLGLTDEVEAPSAGPTPATLPGLICVTRPYYALEQLDFDGERVLATVIPDSLAGDQDSPVAPGEVGRHLAILGSLAGARVWPQPGRHAWPVASSTLELEPGAPVSGRVRLEARCLSVDTARGRAEAEGVMRTAEGRLIGTLRVSYHVIPYDGFVAMFAEHQREIPSSETSPYTRSPERPALRRQGQSFLRTLSPIAAADCAGHFGGLPAMPVSILGRHAQAAVVDAMAALGLSGARVRRAELTTERFAWAGETVTLRVQPDGEAWSCEIRAADALVARFALEMQAEEAAPLRFEAVGALARRELAVGV